MVMPSSARANSSSLNFLRSAIKQRYPWTVYALIMHVRCGVSIEELETVVSDHQNFDPSDQGNPPAQTILKTCLETNQLSRHKTDDF